MKIAVIDISSSGLSMTVAEAGKRKTEICLKERLSLCLPHYTDGGKLSDLGIEKLTSGLVNLKDKCVGLGVEISYLISTAALRYLENCDQISQRVYEATGFPINFIDGKTEAYCDYVANRYYSSLPQAVLMDLGGKSIEICDLSKNKKQDMLYLDFGLLDLHRKFVNKILPSDEESEKMRKYLKKQFSEAELPGKGTYLSAVVVGATGKAVYDIYADYTDVPVEENGMTIEYDKFRKMVKHLLSGKDRTKLILKHAPEKLYLIVPAAITMKALFKRFGVEHIVVSDSGVKEGYLYLVLHTKEKGVCYDYRTGKVNESPFEKEETEVKPEARRRRRSSRSVENSVKADGNEQENFVSDTAESGQQNSVKESELISENTVTDTVTNADTESEK